MKYAGLIANGFRKTWKTWIHLDGYANLKNTRIWSTENPFQTSFHVWNLVVDPDELQQGSFQQDGAKAYNSIS